MTAAVMRDMEMKKILMLNQLKLKLKKNKNPKRSLQRKN